MHVCFEFQVATLTQMRKPRHYGDFEQVLFPGPFVENQPSSFLYHSSLTLRTQRTSSSVHSQFSPFCLQCAGAKEPENRRQGTERAALNIDLAQLKRPGKGTGRQHRQHSYELDIFLRVLYSMVTQCPYEL